MFGAIITSCLSNVIHFFADYKMANFLTAVRTEDCAIVHATEENVKAFVNNNEVAAGKLIISER